MDKIIDCDYAQLKGAFECNFGDFPSSNTVQDKATEAIQSFSSIHDSEITTSSVREIEIETICKVDSQPVAV